MDMPTGQPNGDNSFIEVPSFQMTLVCVRLTKLTSREIKFKSIINKDKHRSDVVLHTCDPNTWEN